jgi:hypothetical protein
MTIIQSCLTPVRWGCAALAALALALTPLRAADATLSISIACSPSVVTMDAVANGDWLTVHTDLSLSQVNTTTVELNVAEQTIAPGMIKADNRGNLVAKFSLIKVRELIAPPTATLTLKGLTKAGTAFAGSDEVRVVE